MSGFDEMLEGVTQGDTYTVTRDGRNVAVILPIGEYEAMVEAMNDSEKTEGDDAP